LGKRAQKPFPTKVDGKFAERHLLPIDPA